MNDKQRNLEVLIFSAIRDYIDFQKIVDAHPERQEQLRDKLTAIESMMNNLRKHYNQ